MFDVLEVCFSLDQIADLALPQNALKYSFATQHTFHKARF